MIWPWFPDHMERRSSPSCTSSLQGRCIQKLHSLRWSQWHFMLCNNPVMLFFCVSVGVDKQCELTCRPAGYRFYVRQAERVRDGTRCFNVSSNDVCVEGRCLVGGFNFACVRCLLQVSEPKSLLLAGWESPWPGCRSLMSPDLNL